MKYGRYKTVVRSLFIILMTVLPLLVVVSISLTVIATQYYLPPTLIAGLAVLGVIAFVVAIFSYMGLSWLHC